MANVVIALRSKAGKLLNISDGGYEWAYIGKDIYSREKIANILGGENRFFLKDKLYGISNTFRQPFLDFVSTLGKQQDVKNWWAGKFTSRSPFLSDFFLLFCYRILVSEIIKENADISRNIYLIIEDCWLFADLKCHYSKNHHVSFLGRSHLNVRKHALILKGIISRLLLSSYLIVARLAIIYFSKREKECNELNHGKDNIAILSYAEQRAFKDDKYIDPYLNGLAELLRNQRLNVLHIINLRFPIKYAKRISRSSTALFPIILDLRIKDILTSIVRRWSPGYETTDLKIDGYTFFYLFKREIWLEFSKAGFNYYLIYYLVFKRFLSRKNCKSLVYLFENQPWEKMLCLSAKESKITKLIGVQHSTVPKYYLSFFLGKNEEKNIPLPHRILTTGSYPSSLLSENGMPLEKIRIGGAWRYRFLWDSTYKIKSTSCNTKKNKKIILVAFPIDAPVAESMFYFMRDVFHSLNDHFIFWLKFHPHLPFSKLKLKNSTYTNYTIVDSPFSEILEKIDILICSCSTVGIEALFAGKKVIRYIPENIICADPLDGIDNKSLFAVYESDNKKDFLHIINSEVQSEVSSALLQSYFQEVKPQVWIEETVQ